MTKNRKAVLTVLSALMLAGIVLFGCNQENFTGSRVKNPDAYLLDIQRMNGIDQYIIEFFRGDLGRGSVGVLSTSQFISVFIAIAGIAMLFLLGRREKHGE